MASRNTSAAASNESAMAPSPFRPAVPNSWSGRPPGCSHPSSGTTDGGVLAALGDSHSKAEPEATPNAFAPAGRGTDNQALAPGANLLPLYSARQQVCARMVGLQGSRMKFLSLARA